MYSGSGETRDNQGSGSSESPPLVSPLSFTRRFLIQDEKSLSLLGNTNGGRPTNVLKLHFERTLSSLSLGPNITSA